jgi:hypothetical protein
MIPAMFSLVAVIGLGMCDGQGGDKGRLTADDVIKIWAPRLDDTTDFQQWIASPKESPSISGGTFRVVGPTFEKLWNHYAELCGIADRYDAKRLLVSGGKGELGSYVISERASSDAAGERGLSMFFLRTAHYTVTVTIQPDPDGEALRGSIAAAIP